MRGGSVPLISCLLFGLALAGTGPAALAEDEPEPYIVQMEWTGFISCAASWPTLGVLPFSGASLCGIYDPSGQHSFLHDWTIESGLKSVVGTMTWESGSSSLAPDLLLILDRAGAPNIPPRYVEAEGSSPVDFRVDEGYVIENYEPEYHPYDFSNVEQSLDLSFRVFAGSDLNVVYQQPFTVYWDLYYHAAAPDGATALPQG